MGISKTQLQDTVQKIKAYVDNKAADISPDFLASEGFGNIRYINGKLQVRSGGQWVDAIADQANQYIINMQPQAMKSFIVAYDSINLSYKLRFEEPDDTIVDGQVICMLDGVKIMRKLGSAPTDENDGIHVTTISRRHFGEHKTEWLFDEDNKAVTGEEWFYKAFPYSTVGFYNYTSLNEGSAVCKDYELYAFRINQAESNPAYMISYPTGCDNENYASAHMDFTAGTFDYGDWKDAFFMQVKPCMLKYDGTVDYYLDPNDYSRKIDGGGSDVANINYDGNCMIEFPKVYYKGVVENDNVATYYFSNKKLDDDFKCWSHLDANGNEIPYCYMSAYQTNITSNSIKSISGLSVYAMANASTTHALAEKINAKSEWDIALFNDRQLINFLLMLIGKNTNVQAVFGYGACSTGSTYWARDTDYKRSGLCNSNGLFWGSSTQTNAVKVFGIENFWGNMFSITVGGAIKNGKKAYKLTYSTADGSSQNGYSVDGIGFIVTDVGVVSTSYSYIKSMDLGSYAIIASVGGATATTYYSDSTAAFVSTNGNAVYGGNMRPTNQNPLFDGTFSELYIGVNQTTDPCTTFLSCKPLAEVN